SSRRRHTRSKRDWSSDVCSSDLEPFQDADGVTVGTVVRADGPGGGRLVVVLDARLPATGLTCRVVLEDGTVRDLAHWMPGYSEEIGRASCRAGVWVWWCARCTED